MFSIEFTDDEAVKRCFLPGGLRDSLILRGLHTPEPRDAEFLPDRVAVFSRPTRVVKKNYKKLSVVCSSRCR